jgi:hypothetical protein
VTEFEVRITEPTGSRMLTQHVSGLSFRSVDPGGYGSVAFDLSRAVDARGFADYSEIAVFDAETGEQVGGGRLQNPGRSIAADGEVWKVSALGEGVAHAQERKNPYFLADSRLDTWYTGDSTSINRKWATGTAPGDESKAGLVFTNNQTTTHAGAFTNANMYDVRRYKQEIGGFKYVHEEGRSSSNSKLEGQLRVVGGSAPTDFFNQNWSTSTTTCSAEKGTDWTAPTAFDLMNLVFVRSSGTLTVDPETDWLIVYSAVIFALRKGQDGADVVGGGAYTKGYVLAHEAVIDALARWCPRFDLANAQIATSATHQHDSLVWPDGINTYDMLDYLMSVEPQFTWAAYEKQPNGLFRFEWRERSTDVRYEISENNNVGFELSGGGYDPLTRLWYTGTELLGHYRTVDVTADNPYAAQNIVPTDTQRIDKTNVGAREWTTDATAMATAAVTNSQFSATSAQVSIAGKILDTFTGRYVKPYQVLPGYVCRIAGVRAQKDTLNTGYEDGAAKFRITSNDFSADSETSRLELNAYSLDEARALSMLFNSGAA